MSQLADYVLNHSERGECKCGKCFKVGEKSHTANLVFFVMKLKGTPSQGELRKLIDQHKGDFGKIDIFDGKEHGYIELGLWIEGQEAALRFIGLGYLVGLFDLLTPRTIMGPDIPEDVCLNMAASGLVSIVLKKEFVEAEV